MVSKLIGKPILSFDAQPYWEHIKSLISTKPNASKEVLGVSISQSKGKTTIRISRSDKSVTRDELSKLAAEYKLDEIILLTIFIKRKIGIFYGYSDPRSQSDQAACEALKANAKSAGSRKRKEKSGDKLLISGSDSHLLAESKVCAS